jgi:transposase-like protein
MASEPKSLQDAIIHFSDAENCNRFMIELRWPDLKVGCPYCGSEKVTYLANAKIYKCYGDHPKAKFSLKVGTIFEDSPIGLDKWFTALWLLVNCKNGISSYEVGRDLGISQKSAWHLMHRLRFSLHSGSFEKLCGHVEVDETFIGGKARNMHASKRAEKIQGRGITGKMVVMGMLQRGGKVRTSVIGERDKQTLHGEVRKNVRKGASVYTDELVSYWGLEENYAHQIINHAEAYVNGKIHTNGIENFWSLLKRGLSGTYVSVEPFHLFRYLDEQAYRYNNRKEMNDFDRFKLAASQIIGKRLTWNQVTGKDDANRLPVC